MLPLDIATSETVPLTQNLLPIYSFSGAISAVRFTVDSKITKSVVTTELYR